MIVVGISSSSFFLVELLTLSCPALTNSSLVEVKETFTDIEPVDQ